MSKTNFPANYPKEDGGKKQYILHPVQFELGGIWRAAEVTEDGYMDPFMNPAKVDFESEELCQRACDLHNNFHGWLEDYVETIISISMNNSMRES